VNADRDKLRTVLDNLLSNAVKFTPRGGMVTIRAIREQSSFVIDFADTGPGIPDEERAQIFEAFFQGRREQGGHVGGTGIGLHDGSVELVDTGEFPGAHFRIHIPQNRIAAQRKLAANE
jgi:two-component system sensor histidine kinase GlrK